jgi:Arm DNA-binding domain
MPRRVAPLSVKKLASVRPGEKPIELVDGFVPGLRVRILPSGTRTWSLNIRDSKGIRRRFEVGPGLSLAEARRKAEDLRRNVRGGADPTTERRAARQRALAAKGGVGTLAALVETYFANGPGARQRRAVKSRQQLETVFATMLNKPLLDIRRAELQLIADNRQSAASASLAIRILRPCLKWAEKRGLVGRDPWDEGRLGFIFRTWLDLRRLSETDLQILSRLGRETLKKDLKSLNVRGRHRTRRSG